MEEYIECTECHNIVKYENGIDHPEGFICHICIQNEFYARLAEFENDPLHKNIPVEDLFQSQERKVIKAFIIAMCLSLIAILTILISILKNGDNDETTTQSFKCDGNWNQEAQKNLN